ncbi:MAG: VacJ family lipoprotein [Burkholderiales bacterium]|nr:VacJ family lipoprotein [Burkholderiales bacterium]MBH2017953.1 VacJ family lipoprotein [Burkholderiales bacterium]
MKQTAQPARTAWRLSAIAGSLALVAGLQGCATPQNRDPMESWNRQVFAFNDSLDAKVLRPVAEGYVEVTPEPVRTGVRNFFNNLRDVWSTVNLFLQGRFGDGAQGIMRVSVNTTLGLAGLIDIATPMRLDRPNEDLGQTLGVWGVGPGAYIVWPLLGPSTLRDSVGIPADMSFSGSMFASSTRDTILTTGLSVVSLRASLLGASNLVDDVALDKYAFTRDAYLQRRQNLIYEGDPPEEDAPLDDEPPAAGTEASQAAQPAGGAVPSAPVTPAVADAVAAPRPLSSLRDLSDVSDPAWALFPADPI